MRYYLILLLLSVLVLGGVLVPTTDAQTDTDDIDVTDHRTTMIRMLAQVRGSQTNQTTTLDVFVAVAESGDERYIAPLVDLGFFARQVDSPVSSAVFLALSELTGLPPETNWQTYFTWASENDVLLPPSYDEFKGLLLAVFIDPNFERFFRPGSMDTANINMLEVVWGGVRVDGIPSLVNARQISPEDAAQEGERLTQFCRDDDCSYPAQDELVFGVSVNGDSRAYPLRILNWHEMFNDVIGHAPLYDAPDGEQVCNFRAPIPFRADQRQGETWVHISGQSPDCPDSGWLAAESIEWLDEGAALESLPEDEPLPGQEAIRGRVKGKPVMLAYCTLCGSGILYDVTLSDLVINGESQEEVALEFSSTGLLMRSNKLMFDRTTHTVWNAMTGVPAFGPLAGTDVRLDILPVVVTDWASWLEQHPDTSVLSLATGYRRDYTVGAAYDSYFNDPNFIMFPVWQQNTEENLNKEMVFALNINNAPKAYPLRTIIPEQITNDTLGGQNIVLVTQESPERDFFEPGGAAVRAYERADYTFRPSDDPLVILDSEDREWQVTETMLIGPDGEELERLGGHLAFWFGWYAFYPDTAVYQG